MPTIAYVVGAYPALSETFVTREVLALRRRGWRVIVIGLWPSTVGGSERNRECEVADLVAYRMGWGAFVREAFAELLRRPVPTLRTGATALADCIFPGEPSPAPQRVRALAQGLAAVRVAGALRTKSVRHVHCHFAHAPTSVGMYLAQQLRVPFSFTGHANDLFERRSGLRRKLQRAAAVAAISRWHRQMYIETEPSCGPKTHLVRCGVDLGEWKRAERVESGSPGALRVLSVGRLVEKKGFDFLIDGLQLATARHGLRWRLTVVGDGPERAGLAALCRELSCEHAVEWAGAVDNCELPALMSRSDLFALTCRQDSNGDRDGLPVSLMEAMACGLPVVAGDLPPIRELVRDGDNGFLVGEGERDLFASRVWRLAEDARLREQMGARARRTIELEFSLEKNIDRLERMFEQRAAPERRARAGAAACREGATGSELVEVK